MKKKCFVAAPIGSKDSDTRKRTDGIYNSIIIPLVKDKMGFDIDISHNMSDSGSITSQIFKHIENDDLVIVDLTELNPNVIYEMAARQATGKPYVLIAEKKDNFQLPFDFAQNRTVFYEDSISGSDELKKQLEKFILSAMDEPDTNNYIYQSAIKVFSNNNNEQPFVDNSICRLIIAKLDAVELNTINQYTNKAAMDFHGFSPYFGVIVHLDVNNTPDDVISKIISKITVYYIRNGVQVAVIIDKKNNYLKIVNGDSDKIIKVILAEIEIKFDLPKLTYEFYDESNNN